MTNPPHAPTDPPGEQGDAPARLNAALEGRYRVVRELGQGGMATVYLAKDLKHDRQVALKVLRPELAAVVGSDRFLAEIKVTAKLQHPNILPLHDSGEADRLLYYVMPYVEGESLADRLERERQLPVDEAVKIATGAANALHFAHERDVVHRDIKPDNILFQSGEAVVADFGIALAMGAGGGARLTETGLSVGTPYYMSPEQATGDQHVGRQSDVYSLGCVLYEMLVGDPPFVGSTAQAVLGQIISGAPVRVTEKRATVPPHVDAVIRRALEKVPADRFANAQDLARALADPGFRHGAAYDRDAAASPRTTGWKRLALALGVVVAVLAGLDAWVALQPEETLQPVRVHLDLTPELDLGVVTPNELALSDDGAFLVYAGVEANQNGLWLRRLRDLESTFIGGTDRGRSPAISPDGSQVAYVAFGEAELRIAPLTGGSPRTVAERAVCCLDWGDDGFIYFVSAGFTIERVPADGGAAEVLADEPTRLEFGPALTSDGEVMIFGSGQPGGDGGDFVSVELRALRLATGEVVTVAEDAVLGRVIRSGHLVALQPNGRLFVAPFDTKTLVAGPSVTVDEGVANLPAPQLAISSSGAIVYSREGWATAEYQPVWVDRSGSVEVVDPAWTVTPGSAASNPGFSLSPDGSKVAIGVAQGTGSDIYVKQLPAGPFSRLTADQGGEIRPRWTADGTGVTYIAGSALSGGQNQFEVRRADGIGEAELLATGTRDVLEGILTAEGWRVLRLGNAILEGNVDIGLFAPGEDTVSIEIASEFLETAFAISPDGRWIAHVSDETGRSEVYVRSFPDPTRFKRQISTAGGMQPVWGRTGRELFYVNEDREMVAVEVSVADEFRVGSTRTLFTIPREAYLLEGDFYAMYDVDVDDQRFLMLHEVEDRESGRLVLILNWLDELRDQLGR